jgi:hypothetical protein
MPAPNKRQAGMVEGMLIEIFDLQITIYDLQFAVY